MKIKSQSEDEAKYFKFTSDSYKYLRAVKIKIVKLAISESVGKTQQQNYNEVKPLFYCELCDERFLHEHNYKEHVILRHNGSGSVPPEDTLARRNLFICQVCNQIFKRKNSLAQHVKYRHDPKRAMKYECIFCTRTFKTNRDFDLHILSHIQEHSHFCKFCSRDFISRKTLSCHLQTHKTARVKDFRCKLCSSKFFTKSDLKRHGEIHSGKKLFKCQSCGSRFGEASKLRIHRMRVHSQARPFKCDSDGCGKTFKMKGDLKIHMIVHTGEKLHCCEICSKRFGKKSDLNSHIRSHMKERCFNCSFCDQSFTCQSSQCRHEKMQHRRRGRETSG